MTSKTDIELIPPEGEVQDNPTISVIPAKGDGTNVTPKTDNVIRRRLRHDQLDWNASIHCQPIMRYDVIQSIEVTREKQLTTCAHHEMMNSSTTKGLTMNELTNDEMRDALRVVLDEIGLTGARSIAWHIIDAEGEKVTSDITDNKAKRIAELRYARMILDSLETVYKEEWDIANGGDEPVYNFG